jgi:hypothetical protein
MDDIEERDDGNDTSILSYSTHRVALVWVKSAVYVSPSAFRQFFKLM